MPFSLPWKSKWNLLNLEVFLQGKIIIFLCLDKIIQIKMIQKRYTELFNMINSGDE